MRTKKKPTMAMQLPGALALAAAGASTTASAATVQITFNNSFISTTSGNHLVTDFGGDGVRDDLYGYFVGGGSPPGGIQMFYGALGGLYLGSAVINTMGVRAGVGGVFGYPVGSSPVTLVVAAGMMRISFTDGNVRGGTATNGYLDLTARASSLERRMTVNRLIFDDATGGTIAGLNVNTTYATYAPTGGGTSAVPEASTSLGLLALGAGGILTRRRSKRAA